MSSSESQWVSSSSPKPPVVTILISILPANHRESNIKDSPRSLAIIVFSALPFKCIKTTILRVSLLLLGKTGQLPNKRSNIMAKDKTTGRLTWLQPQAQTQCHLKFVTVIDL